jgi:hypothetical protein
MEEVEKSLDYDHPPGAALPLETEGAASIFLVKTTFFWRYYNGKGVVGFGCENTLLLPFQ